MGAGDTERRPCGQQLPVSRPSEGRPDAASEQQAGGKPRIGVKQPRGSGPEGGEQATQGTQRRVSSERDTAAAEARQEKLGG